MLAQNQEKTLKIKENTWERLSLLKIHSRAKTLDSVIQNILDERDKRILKMDM